ncbi:hypothetical protein HGP28_10675 [Vibrio sp. SM6]|uniref:Uncharacterized protein n=1 Tax=Vibrio agarilyticus TaxID=2726741 RepID=A0A7X8TR90_9VIBR|nr:hypothetical protein [Vibrio agarilyticus]NLS13356.1 hypothetical protein [Vibrio agarilyticus]
MDETEFDADVSALEDQPAAAEMGDEWGAIINQIERDEVAALPVELAANEDSYHDADMMSGALSVLFTVAEQATAIISGVDFEFDEKGKQAVTEAALPVLKKHGGKLTAWFGDYVEEGVLALALLSLVYSAKKSIATAQRAQLEEQKRDEKEKAA